MASIRRLLKDYIADNGMPSTIENIDELFAKLVSEADEPDIDKAIRFYQQNAFTNALISLGYYRSGAGCVCNEKCEDPGMIYVLASRAKEQTRRMGRRYKKFGKLANEVYGQMIFDVGDDNELIISEAK